MSHKQSNHNFSKHTTKPLQHGGILTFRKRRSKRPLKPKFPLHVVLRSDLAGGKRNLMKHKTLIERLLRKFSKRFSIKVYERAICHDHIHLLIKGKTRTGIQNFFRVIAGHVAQQILIMCPLSLAEERHLDSNYCKKNQRKFWSLLVYTRLVNWHIDFRNVSRYIVQNTLEALGLVSYKTRNRSSNRFKFGANSS